MNSGSFFIATLIGVMLGASVALGVVHRESIADWFNDRVYDIRVAAGRLLRKDLRAPQLDGRPACSPLAPSASVDEAAACANAQTEATREASDQLTGGSTR